MKKPKNFFKIKYFVLILLIVIIDFAVSYYLFIIRPAKDKSQSYLPLQIKQLINPNNAWSLLVTGDIIPARSVNAQMVRKNDFDWALRGISEVLQNADLTLINLEAPLLANCDVTDEGMNFCGDRRFAQSLKNSGVDIVNLANNHSLNYGWEGITETEKYLTELGMETVGFSSSSVIPASSSVIPASSSVIPAKAGIRDRIPDQVGDDGDDIICTNNIFCSKKAIKTVKNTKIGFLGYNTVGQKLDRELVSQQITQTKNNCDVLVISIHWGQEYSSVPQPESENPQELGKWLIDQGADIIVGNHPHVIQTHEFYQNGVIFYALGNTVFDQEWSEGTKKGILAKLYFDGMRLQQDKLEIIPIGIRNYGEAYISN